MEKKFLTNNVKYLKFFMFQTVPNFSAKNLIACQYSFFSKIIILSAYNKTKRFIMVVIIFRAQTYFYTTEEDRTNTVSRFVRNSQQTEMHCETRCNSRGKSAL